MEVTILELEVGLWRMTLVFSAQSESSMGGTLEVISYVCLSVT